jgi:anthranilate synthase component 2
LIEQLGQELPILGVCLGHQGIGQVFGGKIIPAPELMHGKTSQVSHTGVGVFRGLENPLTATRYHSLVIERETCPDVLEITAWVEDNTIMGVRHRNYPHIQGVQFHPESVLTSSGKQLLRNFLEQLHSRA